MDVMDRRDFARVEFKMIFRGTSSIKTSRMYYYTLRSLIPMCTDIGMEAFNIPYYGELSSDNTPLLQPL